ncbi:peptide deformylase, partial [Klebsiella aerogenes]
MALRLPGLQTTSTHILPGGAALTGPTNGINLHPARWRCAYRAYKW